MDHTAQRIQTEKLENVRRKTGISKEHKLVVGDYVLLKQSRCKQVDQFIVIRGKIDSPTVLIGSSIATRRVYSMGERCYRDASQFRLADRVVWRMKISVPKSDQTEQGDDWREKTLQAGTGTCSNHLDLEWHVPLREHEYRQVMDTGTGKWETPNQKSTRHSRGWPTQPPSQQGWHDHQPTWGTMWLIYEGRCSPTSVLTTFFSFHSRQFYQGRETTQFNLKFCIYIKKIVQSKRRIDKKKVRRILS